MENQNNKTEKNINKKSNYRANLIQLVREHQFLWDQRDIFFSDRNLKIKTWNKIARELEETPAKVRRTWENLRDQFRRDLKRQISCGVKSKWHFFDDMSFIRSMVRIKEIQNDNSDSESDGPSILASGLPPTPTLENIGIPQMPALVSLTKTESITDAEQQQQGQNETICQDAVHEGENQMQIEQQKYDDAEVNFHIRELVKIEISTDSNDEQLEMNNEIRQSPQISPNASLSRYEYEQKPSTPETCVSTSVSHKRLSHLENNDYLGVPNEIENSLEQDEDYHFVMSILPTLKNIQPHRKFALRLTIMNAISNELNENG